MAEPERLKKEAKELKKTAEYLEQEAEKQEEDVGAAKETTGYEPNEILKAPVQPPKTDSSSKVKPSQIRSIVAGFALVIIAVTVWPIFGTSVALAVALVGATFIALGTLTKI